MLTLLKIKKNTKNFIDLNSLKEDFRKLGINFVTAGVAGVFINHLADSKLSSMFWTSLWITSIGILFLFLGIIRRKRT